MGETRKFEFLEVRVLNFKMTRENKIIVFKNAKIRRTWYKSDWWFCIVDIIQALTDSQSPNNYLRNLRRRDQEFKNTFDKGGGQFDPPLRLDIETAGGNQKVYCWNTQGIFRLIQSIPSKKAEPFKLWLAKVGQERIDEIENPQLAQERMKKLYEEKGYSKDWIDKRLRGIAIRQNLTDEWKDRGVKESKDFAILTNQIHQATFNIPIKEHKKLKNLPKKSKANLRDNMTDLELIFSMLGERATTEITQSKNSQGFDKLKEDANKGGNIAKNARLELEKTTKKKVVSQQNLLK